MLPYIVYGKDDCLPRRHLRCPKGLAKRSSKAQAQLIRDALRAFAISGDYPPLPAGMGMFDSGYTDTVKRRKELLKQAARSRQWRS